MTEKTRTTMWLYPNDRKRMKMLAAEADRPVGDVINDMLNFIEQRAEQRRRMLKDSKGQPTLNLALMAEETIQDMIDHADVLRRDEGGWAAEDGFSMKAKAAEIKRREGEDDDEE